MLVDKNKAFSSAGNWTLLSSKFYEKRFVLQNDRLVTWFQAKNSPGKIPQNATKHVKNDFKYHRNNLSTDITLKFSVNAASYYKKIFNSYLPFLTILGQKHNFAKRWSSIDSLDSPYDYASIMHYGKRDFAKWPWQVTIRTKNGAKIGQRRHLSKLDREKMNKYYNCNKK